jgi:hypothetical protein
MTHPKPGKMSFEQVLLLVEQLPASEQEQLRLRLNGNAWGHDWDALSNRIQAKFQAEGDPIPTEEEVVAEVKAARIQRKKQRAEGSN